MAVDVEEAVRNLRRRIENVDPADARAAAEARARLAAIAGALRGSGAERAWLFGSLANGSFTAASDIDIAVEGISPWRIVHVQEELTDVAGRAVDLVPLELAQPWLRELVKSGAERLF